MNLRRGPYGSPISGVVHFEKRQAEFCPLVKPPFFKRPYFSPIVSAYRLALRPVTTRISSAIQEQSPEVRQLFENGDEAALGGWMQTHFQNGLRYIPDDVALAQANIMRRLLAVASPAGCVGAR